MWLPRSDTGRKSANRGRYLLPQPGFRHCRLAIRPRLAKILGPLEYGQLSPERQQVQMFLYPIKTVQKAISPNLYKPSRRYELHLDGASPNPTLWQIPLDPTLKLQP